VNRSLISPRAFCGLLASLLASLLAPARASAQQATPLDHLQPAPAGDAFLAVPQATVSDAFRFSATALLSYANEPLKLSITRASGAVDKVTLVSQQTTAHGLLAVELFGRLKLDLDVPATVAQSGSATSLNGGPVAAASGANLNDLRAGARLEVLEPDGWRPAAALGFTAWFPSGSQSSYGGSSATRFAPGLMVSGEAGSVLWGLALARRYQSTDAGSLQASDITASAAAALRLGALQLGPEIWVTSAAESTEPASFHHKGTGAELLATGRYHAGPLAISLGFGPGFGTAPGVPRFRGLLAVGYEPEVVRAPRHEPSETGESPRILGSPMVFPVGIGGVGEPAVPFRGTLGAPPLPPPDRDSDGVPDADDLCPDDAGDPAGARRGCPPDKDNDGIPDRDDRCPDEAGVASLDPAKNGCPPDTDGDGIVDAKDACPREKGEASADPKLNGCPKGVRVEGEQIVILQQVSFATGKEVIQSDSFGLLQQIADVMQQHPEIARVAVDGHTDNKGPERANVELSRRRAAAVERWLVEHGVDARRLEARGFGPRRPIADNKTDAGRSKNRRVEFQILRRSAEGEAGWKDGSL
jgi:outer membrane protein OmpA-like peptidoglycan-associated protein